MTTTTPDTFTSPAIDAGSGLREGYAEIGDVELHYVEAGDGPLVVLLHGFPEFWYGWRQQIAPLVKAGFRVVAPDLRGYNLSSKPDGYAAYTADKLAGDIRGLIRELGAESAMVVGHDWGGTVAWTLAANHPEVVDRLVILNAAHPRRLNEGLRNPRQLLRSWYFFYFQFPKLPERRARRRHWRFFKRFLRDARPPYTAEEIDRYVEAWSQPGAAKAMIDYYRAAVRLSSKQGELRPDLGAHPGHLGAGRSLPRPQARRAAPRGRAQPRPGRAPARRVPLGPPRRGRARERAARRLPRPRPREPERPHDVAARRTDSSRAQKNVGRHRRRRWRPTPRSGTIGERAGPIRGRSCPWSSRRSPCARKGPFCSWRSRPRP